MNIFSKKELNRDKDKILKYIEKIYNMTSKVKIVKNKNLKKYVY